MKAIEFADVSFRYEEEGPFAVRHLNFSVDEGEFVAVLGHNGSGKSTLARLANGLLMPDEGSVRVFGQTVHDKNLYDVRSKVGVVFQNPDNQTVATIVEDDVAFGAENVGLPREEIGARIDFALRAVGMEEYRTATVARLSGGQKQRIAIAGVLALKPRVVILDESTAMLDLDDLAAGARSSRSSPASTGRRASPSSSSRTLWRRRCLPAAPWS